VAFRLQNCGLEAEGALQRDPAQRRVAGVEAARELGGLTKLRRAEIAVGRREVRIVEEVGGLQSDGKVVAPARAGATAKGTAMAAVAGSFDITGSALFIFASQHGRLDEAVVISSLYPAVTVILARLILKEHFSRWRFIGLLAALAAVPMIAAG